MKKIAILMTPLLLFTPIMFIDFAPEDDGTIVKTVEDTLMYEVYKIDVSSALSISSYSDTLVHMIFFYADDSDEKEEFEEALRNREPLPPGREIEWAENIWWYEDDWNEVSRYDLTVYIFGYPVEVWYDYSNMYVSIAEWKSDGYEYASRYIMDKDRLKIDSPSTNLIAGQDVKITISDAPEDVSLILYSSAQRSDLGSGANFVEIEKRGDFIVTGENWAGSSPYISYTIEYEGLSPKTTTYGFGFLAVGILFFGIMIFFARPQKIKD